ncbi:hypothetical protein SAMN05428988_2021 [Chitinophaga sp. YR573]|uniref:hypothetical protein n=1 Tax=Chitinophaga sp. YR573 TaxID=1881040 RepID=UPI0008D69468|nr:hypothetical protein [Chitinophaga sp. YR573]SEW09878.1 hypothetical protein SAMN05428988_2021 [Chitinophaga sp. YR573]
MKIAMAHKQAAFRIKHWYLMHHRVIESYIKGTEAFTLFEKLTVEKQTEISKKIKFNSQEIPVLVLIINTNKYVVNTSERFIKITSKNIESVYYEEFEAMICYQSIYAEIKKLPPQKLVDVGLKKTDGDMAFLKIPAGEFHHFWDVARRLDTIRIINDK